MLKQASLVLFLLQAVGLVSASVSFNVSLELSNSTGMWELTSSEYEIALLVGLRALNTNVKSGTNAPYDPLKRGMRIFAFTKLVITAPHSGNETCKQALNAWLRTVDLNLEAAESLNLTHGPIPQCVDATTLSAVGIHGSWSTTGIPNTSGNVKANPINLKYLNLGGFLGEEIPNIGRILFKSASLDEQTNLFSQWINYNNQILCNSGDKKVFFGADLGFDQIMLLLDVIKFQTLVPFQADESEINTEFDGKPDALQIVEERSVTPVGKEDFTYVLRVRKNIYPDMSKNRKDDNHEDKHQTDRERDQNVKGHVTDLPNNESPQKHVDTTTKAVDQGGQVEPAMSVEVSLLLFAVIFAVAITIMLLCRKLGYMN